MVLDTKMSTTGLIYSPSVSSTDSSKANSTCSTGCIAALSTVIPITVLTVFGIVFYYAWGRGILEKKRRKKEERAIAIRKLGEESDVESMVEGRGGLEGGRR